MTETIDLDLLQDDPIGLDLSQDGTIELDLDSGSGAPGSYLPLTHKPKIEGVVLVGDRTLPEIGVGLISEQDIDNIIYG